MAVWLLAQGPGLVSAPAATILPAPGGPATAPVQVPARCDAKPWAWLKGRGVGEVLAVRLPEGALVQHVNDGPIRPSGRPEGRLTIEIGRNTRVRRVFCG